MTKKLTYVYLVPLAILFALNAFFSLTSTTFFELYLENEVPSYQHDHLWILIPALALWVGCAFLLYKKNILEQIPYKGMCIGTGIYTFLLCDIFIWIFHCGVVCDAMHVSEVAVQFLQGDYASFFNSEYFQIYPFQVHMAAYFQLIYTLFGAENYLAFQLLNAVCITGVIFLLQKITYELFEDELLVKWEMLVSLMLIPFFMYSTYIYGDVPGFALALLSIYFVIRYLKNGHIKYAIAGGISLGIGLIVKENDAIVLMAILIVIFLKVIQDRNWKPIIAGLIILALSQTGTKLVDAVYLDKAQMSEMPPGTPLISWVVMGIQDYGDESVNGCGWYNGYNMDVYRAADYDYDTAVQMSINSIKEAAMEHLNNPAHAVYYYYRKFVSQWNDPTFQSQIMNEWYGRHVKQTAAWSFFNYGLGRSLLFHLMNVIHFIMFFFIAIGLFVFLRKWSLEGSLILLSVFGGTLFHELVWESKGRYVLPYYVMLIPFAALGCVTLLKWLDEKVHTKVLRGKEKD